MVVKDTHAAAQMLNNANVALTEEQYVEVLSVMETYAKEIHKETLKQISEKTDSILMALNQKYPFDKIDKKCF